MITSPGFEQLRNDSTADFTYTSELISFVGMGVGTHIIPTRGLDDSNEFDCNLIFCFLYYVDYYKLR